MQNQPKYKPLHESEFFSDHRSERPMVNDTVPRGYLRVDQARYAGKMGGKDVDYFPIPITRADLERGMDRFNIYCSPCHSRLGDGNGMIVRRGYMNPPSYYTDRLMKAPVGHFFDVMTNGFGAMPSYASRVTPDDRWRIAAYIRALQFSQSASINDVPPEDRAKLTAPGGAPAQPEQRPFLPGQTSGQTSMSPPNPPPQSSAGPSEVPSPFSGVIPPAVPYNANTPTGGQPGRPYGEASAGAEPGNYPPQSTTTVQGGNPQ